MSLTRDAGAQCPQRRRRPPQAHPGPLQALLEDALTRSTVRARLLRRKPPRQTQQMSAPREPSEGTWVPGGGLMIVTASSNTISARAPPSTKGTTAMSGGTASAHAHCASGPGRARFPAASSEGSWRRLLNSSLSLQSRILWRTLTVKLRGRTEAHAGAEGAQFPSARGAKPQAHHGPLQRLLGVTATTRTTRAKPAPASVTTSTDIAAA